MDAFHDLLVLRRGLGLYSFLKMICLDRKEVALANQDFEEACKWRDCWDSWKSALKKSTAL